jgi:hypothetical protein
MPVWRCVVLVAVVGSSAFADDSGKWPPATVPVCLSSPLDPAASYALVIASRIFAEIAVRIEWLRKEESCRSQPGRILTVRTDSVDAAKYPGALARAYVYEGARIDVFYGRLQKVVTQDRVPVLLGHVLAHEIAHMLQGLELHQDTGVMKAAWSRVDYATMVRKPLSFTPRDAELIHLGLQSRAKRFAQERP